MQVAIYGRKSKKDDTSEVSLARQVELCHEFIAKQRGWTVAPQHVFTDEGISGAEFDRPGLNALLAAVNAMAVDALVVADSSRLGRDMDDTALLQRRLMRAGVRVFYYETGQELLRNTPTQKLVASVTNFAAEDYRYTIKTKTALALRKKAQQGHACGNRLYGYRAVQAAGASHKVRQVHEPEALVVRRIFKLYVDGRGTRNIARQLNAEGVPGPRSKGWRQASIRDLLKNPTYKGLVVFSRSQNVDGGPRRRRPSSEWVTASMPQLRIVPDALWQAVQDRAADLNAVYLRANGGRLESKPCNGVESKYLLTGLARCGVCGGPMGVAARTKKGERSTFLRCRANHERGGAACKNGQGIPLAKADRAVLHAVQALLEDDVVYAVVYPTISAPRTADALAAGRTALVDALAQAERAVQRLTEAIANGAGSVASVVADLKAKDRQRQTLAAQLQQLDRAAHQPALTSTSFLERVRQAAAGYQALAKQNPQVARARLRKLLTSGRITFHPATADGTVRFQAEVSYLPVVADLNLPAFQPPPAHGTGRSTGPTAGPTSPRRCASPSSRRPSS